MKSISAAIIALAGTIGLVASVQFLGSGGTKFLQDVHSICFITFAAILIVGMFAWGILVKTEN